MTRTGQARAPHDSTARQHRTTGVRHRPHDEGSETMPTSTGGVTIEELRDILIRCAGEVEGLDTSGDILDLNFDDIGYDSLALMETAAALQRQFGVQLSDEEAMSLRTPRELLDVVNAQLAGQAP
ncbi:MAG TPA: acyl carrier protein [Kineosporiaceae bacterium]